MRSQIGLLIRKLLQRLRPPVSDFRAPSPSEARRTPDVPTGRGCRASEGGWLRAGDLDPSCRRGWAPPFVHSKERGLLCVRAALAHACAPGMRVCACRGWPGLLRLQEDQGLCSWAAGDLSCVCSPGNVRISDLGLAVELKEGQTKTKGYAGTPGEGSLRAQPLWGQGQGLSWGPVAQGRGVVNAGVSENCSAICRGGKGHDQSWSPRSWGPGARGGGMVNTGVSENCSLIRRGGRETAGGLHSCVEVAPVPTLGDGSSLVPRWAESGVRTEGSRAEGGATGRGPGRGSAVGIPGGRRGDGLRGPRSTLPHAAWPRGGCAVRAALVQSACVCSRECAQGVLPPSPLTPSGWEQRLHSGGRGGGLTTQAPGGRRAPRLTFRLPCPPRSRRPWLSAGFPGNSAPPVCSALGRKKGPGTGASGFPSVPSWALSSFGGCLSPR